MMTIRKAMLAAALVITLIAPYPGRVDAATSVAETHVNAAVAPQFSAKSVQGVLLSSQKLAGKAYIVNFFGSWCPYCRKEIPEMVALQEKYEKKGFTFIGMAYKDNEHSMPDFIWEQGINYPVIMADKSILKSFGSHVSGGIASVPLLFAVGRDGRLVAVEPGAQTREDLEKLILKIMQGSAKP
ncbi:TlpA family protein disulfide reductase [Pelodictyon phaeoclathratiforme]|jgi:thiol-disulfide isomerase/thioredoxin|nr:TlpA disulfide reductase family protein [Pelodictyon phaeoclathratiforme]MBV5289909.1 TlpA family protein disulfide reductase [Pelodictyon phaeoclathratiforme]